MHLIKSKISLIITSDALLGDDGGWEWVPVDKKTTYGY